MPAYHQSNTQHYCSGKKLKSQYMIGFPDINCLKWIRMNHNWPLESTYVAGSRPQLLNTTVIDLEHSANLNVHNEGRTHVDTLLKIFFISFISSPGGMVCDFAGPNYPSL